MNFFDLPTTTKIFRVIPKNAFDDYTNTKQKKSLTDCIQRITWTHKLSENTLNLDTKDIKEIQVFKVELKKKLEILKILEILEIINKAIPYHIVCWVEYEDEALVSASQKHPHPTNENISVVDWTFKSGWFVKNQNNFTLNLKGSIDQVFKDLCIQLTGKPELGRKSLGAILQNQKEIYLLEKEINRLKSLIRKCNQFNEKVEMNLKLKAIEKKLKLIEDINGNFG